MEELFSNIVNKTLEEIDGITNPADKAKVLATLAIAVANAGNYTVVNNTGSKREDFSEEVQDEPEKEIAKDNKESSRQEERSVEESKFILKNEELKQKYQNILNGINNFKEKYKDSFASINKMFDKNFVSLEDFLTEENIESYIDFLKEANKFYNYIVGFGNVKIERCINAYSEGNYKTIKDINKDNIKGFNLYMKMLVANAKEKNKEKAVAAAQ